MARRPGRRHVSEQGVAGLAGALTRPLLHLGWVLALCCLSPVAAHGAASADSSGPTRGATGEEMPEFAGTVVHLDLEGGFWGIVTTDGRRFEPLDLPEGLQRQGLRVRVTAQPVPRVAGSHMWGTVIRVLDIVPTAATDGASGGAPLGD